jgi:hypothetical protein
MRRDRVGAEDGHALSDCLSINSISPEPLLVDCVELLILQGSLTSLAPRGTSPAPLIAAEPPGIP